MLKSPCFPNQYLIPCSLLSDEKSGANHFPTSSLRAATSTS